MKHIVVKYTYGFFDLDWQYSLTTSITKKKKMFSTKWYLDIYQDNRLVKSLEFETEQEANKNEKILLDDIKDGLSVSFLI